MSWDFVIGRKVDLVWWQMSIRAAIVFVYAIALYRLVPRKALGGSATLDIVLTVIVGSSLARALTGNAPLLPTLAATTVLALLYSLVSELARRWSPISKIVKGRPILVVREGKVDARAMRRSGLGEGDLLESLRLKGVERVEDVARAYIERNGAVSVFKEG